MNLSSTASASCSAWEVSYQHDEDHALAQNLVDQLPKDLKEFVPEHFPRPTRLRLQVVPRAKKEVIAIRRYNPDWIENSRKVSLRMRATWNEEIYETYFHEAIERGLEISRAHEAVERKLRVINVAILCKITVLLNICWPGFASSRFIASWTGGRSIQEIDTCHSWVQNIWDEPEIQHINYPEIPAEKVLNWAATLPGVWAGVPTSNVGRAFSNFSNLFGDFESSGFERMMWAIGALDALYCDSNVGISEKLKARVPLIIPGVSKKLLNKIYSERSRVVHGDVSFPSKYINPYNLEDMDTYYFLITTMPHIMMIVLQTFCYCIQNNQHELSFGTTLQA